MSIDHLVPVALYHLTQPRAEDKLLFILVYLKQAPNTVLQPTRFA